MENHPTPWEPKSRRPRGIDAPKQIKPSGSFLLLRLADRRRHGRLLWLWEAGVFASHFPWFSLCRSFGKSFELGCGAIGQRKALEEQVGEGAAGQKTAELGSQWPCGSWRTPPSSLSLLPGRGQAKAKE